jgi:hypothetical protein
MGTPMRSALAGLLVWWVGSSCSKSSRPHVERLTVARFEGGDFLGLGPEALDQRLRARLEQARFVVLAPGAEVPEGVTPWRLSLDVTAEEPEPQVGAQIVVGAELSLSQKGTAQFEARVFRAKTPTSHEVDAVQATGRETLDEALAEVVAQGAALIELTPLRDAQVEGALAGGTPARREAAVVLLARRGRPAALEPLLERLKARDQNDVRRAMGLLVELKDPRAVPALIDVAERRNALVLREVIFALGAIGGDEAEAYLYTVSQGHDDALIRASAQQALDDLKQRPAHGPAPKAQTP